MDTKEMLIDLHAHSSGISRCCRIPYEEVLRRAQDHGMDGIVLTNHYQKGYVQGDLDALVEKYIGEFHKTEAYGKQIGRRVFFGIEVTMELDPRVHMLVYGVEPDFLREHPTVFDYTHEQLHAAVKSWGGVLVQAHPFRNGATVWDTAFLDGIEINCHPLYGNSYSKEMIEIARDRGLTVTCGGDYHADTYRPRCGMFLPEGIRDHHDLGAYLLSGTEKELCVQEPNTDLCVKIRVR